MKKVKTLLFGIGMLCIATANAQVDLRLDSVLIGLNSTTLYKGSTYNVSITIINDSATDFVGVINIGSSINGELVTDTSAGAPIYFASSGELDTIPALAGQITRVLTINTNNNSFIVGPSGVVIWPIAVSTTPHLTVKIADTLGINFTILNPLGIDEISARNLKVYMSGQDLMIQNSGNYLLKNVRLYDVAGNLLLQKELMVSGKVNMGQFANGVYLAQITFADNTKAVVKVVNTR